MKKTSHTPKLFSTKSVTALISWLFVVTAIGISAGVFSFFQSMEKLAQADLQKRVEVSLNVERQRQEDLLEEYSYWDESYENTIANFNPAWVENNTGLYMTDRYGFEFTLAIRPDRSTAFTTTIEGGTPINFQYLMAQGLSTLLKETQKSESVAQVVSGYIPLLDGVFLVSVGPYIDEVEEVPRPDRAYLVFAQRLNQTYMDNLAELYQLPGLRITSAPIQGKPGATLISVHDVPTAYLSWDTPTSTQGLLPKLLIVVAGFFFLAGVLIRLILKREHANRDEYEDQLYLQATKDSLTGANNRRHFIEMAKQEFAIHKRNQRILSVVMLDLDHFKKINDNYGHDIGDKALIHFADLCQSSLRSADIFGRIGGEEFAIILPDTGINGAALVGERLRDRLEQTTDRTGLDIPPMTVSIGVATMEENDLFSTMMRNADKALYTAKKNGRNRVEAFEEAG